MSDAIQNPTVLTGGPLGGTVVDQADWPFGETRQFSYQPEDGPEEKLIYRNEDGVHAIFCGSAPDA